MSAALVPAALKCELRAAEYLYDLRKDGTWSPSKREPRHDPSGRLGFTGSYAEVAAVAHELNTQQRASGSFDFAYFPEPLGSTKVKDEIRK